MKMENGGGKMSVDTPPVHQIGAGSVIVTNKNDEEYARKYDGDSYVFPPDEPVTIPEIAAAYLFAYGLTDDDRTRICIRNGWQRNGMPGDEFGPTAAMKRLKNFVFRKGPESKAPEKPIKKVAPPMGQTGINAVSAHAKDDGRKILPRDTIRIPGSTGPLAPPAP